MPRYFFNVADDECTFPDEDGEVHRSAADAIVKAAAIASELARDSETYRGYHVSVVDEGGREITRVPVKASN